MIQEKSFKLHLKNDQLIELKFTSIPQTNNQLWQMFATTEALEIVQKLINFKDSGITKKVEPEKKAPSKKKSK